MTLVWWHSVQAAPSVKTASVYVTGKDTPEATSASLASTQPQLPLPSEPLLGAQTSAMGFSSLEPSVSNQSFSSCCRCRHFHGKESKGQPC